MIFASDASKWLIKKCASGKWAAYPPVTDGPDWADRFSIFNTGAEALAAFAQEQP